MSKRRKRAGGNPKARRPSGPEPRPAPRSDPWAPFADGLGPEGWGGRGRPSSGGAGDGPGSTDQARAVLIRAIRRGRGRRRDAAAEHALAAMPEGPVAVAIDDLADSMTESAWSGGWQPAEVVWQARRVGATVGEVVAMAVARSTHAFDRTSMHPAWRAQLDDLRLTGEGARPGLARRAREAYGLGPVLDALARLNTLPVTEVLLPVPGRPDIALAAAAGFDDQGIDAKLLGRVRALLAKAEGTEFEAEAHAFTAKAHDLMTRHNLEHALVAAGPTTSRRPAARRFCIDDPYAEPKMMLLTVISSVSRCQAVMFVELNMVTVVGFPDDLSAVDMLFTSLLVQAQTALDVLVRATAPGSRERSRGFKASFLRGFAHRIGTRLEATGQATVDDLDRSSGGALVPVLAARSEAVEDQVATMFPSLRRKAMAGPTDALGWHAGQDAADQADLPWERLGGSSR